ncbi:Lrp/AsnC family transcriptional regulator [Aliikangiella coralliicola]|uniref:Lrp/AsnC family transcriptional regulator n=1 Tax=Aliikangiella coralliicola TaxID=2592383 RepID=A0A545UD82_9GAMM|nr:Lrp/AsnC family transcriptional regulator [Aliikangiella coralliicola]TQV87422.1 Lrp/AsnC family transcriptional regulator [Aliikangiella coralliicola]
MNNSQQLDRIDIAILAELQRNGRIKNVDLAEKVALSASPCLQRVKRLEKMGFITRYCAEIEINKITEVVEVFTQITISKHTLEDHSYFEREITKIPEVMECYLVSGGYDYLVKFTCRSIIHYQNTIQQLLDSELGIFKYHSYVVMKTIASKREYPISHLTKNLPASSS